MRADEPNLNLGQEASITIHGARYAASPNRNLAGSILVDQGRISRIFTSPPQQFPGVWGKSKIDLSGFLILPGLINAHDHLDFALFPRLAVPPHRNYIDWGDEIHRQFPETIAKYRAVPKAIRIWWGGIRNLLCGVTTVCHHNPLWPDLQGVDFPVRVIQKQGWGHSLALGGDLRTARAVTPSGCPFIVHACEGTDNHARDEIYELDKLGLLDTAMVIVHGLALDRKGIALMKRRGASLVVCPSSNHFLFHQLPDMSCLNTIKRVALGSDSPLTAEGDLLDELRFLIHRCRVASQAAYRMVTILPATILRLRNAEGTIQESGTADLIAVKDTGACAAERIEALFFTDVEFVMIGGSVRLASRAIRDRLPLTLKRGLEPIAISGTIRWVRAPVAELLRNTESVLGTGAVRLGSRLINTPMMEVERAS